MNVASQAAFPKTTRKAWYSRLTVAIRLLVVVAIYVVIFRTVDVAGILDKLSAPMAWAFAAGVLMLLGQVAICTARWRMLVEAGSSPPAFAGSYWAYLEGSFLNQALPSTVGGDAWRVIRWRAAGLSLGAAAGSVFMDRLSGAMGAAILAVFAAWLLSRHGVGAYWTLSILFLGTLVLVSGALLTLLMRPSILRVFQRLPKIHDALVNIQASLVVDRRYLVSLVYSVGGHCLPGLAVYATALSLGVDLSLVMIICITGAVLLLSTIPISLAGWGVREAAFVTLLVPLGVSSQDALLLGILFGLAGLVSALPGGVSFLAARWKDRVGSSASPSD